MDELKEFKLLFSQSRLMAFSSSLEKKGPSTPWKKRKKKEGALERSEDMAKLIELNCPKPKQPDSNWTQRRAKGVPYFGFNTNFDDPNPPRMYLYLFCIVLTSQLNRQLVGMNLI